MKRNQIEAGGEYATDTGVRVRIEGIDPGWAVDAETGDWVEAKATGQRFIKNKGYVPYQTNIAIRGTVVDTGRKIVVEPRHLVATWEAYSAEQEVVQEQVGLAQANAQALALRASKAGIEPLVDPDRQEVVMGFEAFDTLLRKAKV